MHIVVVTITALYQVCHGNLYRLVSERGGGRSANKTRFMRATLQYVTMFRLSVAMPAANRARSPSSVDARAHVLFLM